jgi:UDP-glucose 4-epimerase
MKILVLGGRGFIGSHIVESLYKESHDVRILAKERSAFQHRGEWICGDYLDKEILRKALANVDAVIHCISTTVPATSALNPIYDIETNLIGTVNLMQLMQEANVSQLIYLSSGGTVYGDPEVNPVDESHSLNPISSYGAVKVAIEKFIQISQRSWGLTSVILRPSNPYGERQGHNGVQGIVSTVLNNIIQRKTTDIYGDGSAIRDYIYVKDVSSLVCKVIGSDRTGVYNAGSGVGYSVLDVIGAIERATGETVELNYKPSRGFDVKSIILDSNKAYEHFGWKASVSLDAGIKKHYDWLKTQYGRSTR